MANVSRGAITGFASNLREQLVRVTVQVDQLMAGKHRAHGTMTLDTGAASTAFTDSRVGGNSVITYSPTTANASAEIGAGTIYISSTGDETFTVTHANNAQADRTFNYTISG